MRKQLRKLEDVRATFSGIFVRLGFKSDFGHPKQTLLLKDVRNDSGDIVCDHLWFNLTKGFGKLELQEGDTVRFDARVKEYCKGYFGHREDVYKPPELDYKLSHPTKLQKIPKA